MSILFDQVFEVDTVDKDGKKFDRVSRITATSPTHSLSLILDIASELYPLQPSDNFSLVLARTLSTASAPADGAAADGAETSGGWRPGKEDEGLAEEYEYVCYGKVYKFDEGKEEVVTAYVSFGGLLLALSGHVRHLSNLVVGENVYLLMRR